jgi:hypothetical protein
MVVVAVVLAAVQVTLMVEMVAGVEVELVGTQVTGVTAAQMPIILQPPVVILVPVAVEVPEVAVVVGTMAQAVGVWVF